jgi:hypothetical protein
VSDTPAKRFWDETCIDEAISEIARIAAARLDARHDDLAAAVKSERDRRPDIEAFSSLDELCADREKIRTVLLKDEHPGFRVVRRMLPLDALVSAEERADAFRNGTASPLGAHYTERWATPLPPVDGWAENVVEQLLARHRMLGVVAGEPLTVDLFEQPDIADVEVIDRSKLLRRLGRQQFKPGQILKLEASRHIADLRTSAETLVLPFLSRPTGDIMWSTIANT